MCSAHTFQVSFIKVYQVSPPRWSRFRDELNYFTLCILEKLFCNLWDENLWVYRKKILLLFASFQLHWLQLALQVRQKPLCNLQLFERWGFRFFMSISLPYIHEFWLLMQFVSKALLNWQAALMGVHAQMVWLWVKNKSFVCIQGNWTQYLITRQYCTFIWMPYRFKTRCTTSGNQLFCRLNLISAAL